MSQKGFVYILSNPSMPGLVKIGKTCRDVDQRANELYQTGVPLPFIIEHEVLSPDCGELESWVHTVLSGFRVSDNREFFKIPVTGAVKSLGDCLYEQVGNLVHEFLPDQNLVDCDLYVCEGHISFMASEVGVPAPSIAEAFAKITPEELLPALLRVLEVE